MPAHPSVVIQSIKTIWSKASRGGAGAVARNRTPGALELPAVALQPTNDFLFLHELVYFERNHFEQPLEKLVQRERTEPFRYDCLKLSLVENTLCVTLEWERLPGSPRRLVYPRTEFFLQEQQWCQIIYNFREALRDFGWNYEKHVLNIGLLPPSSPKMFLETKPAHKYIDLAHLW